MRSSPRRCALALASLIGTQTGCATEALRKSTEADWERAVYTPVPGSGALELSGSGSQASFSLVAGARTLEASNPLAVAVRVERDTADWEKFLRAVPRGMFRPGDEVLACYGGFHDPPQDRREGYATQGMRDWVYGGGDAHGQRRWYRSRSSGEDIVLEGQDENADGTLGPPSSAVYHDTRVTHAVVGRDHEQRAFVAVLGPRGWKRHTAKVACERLSPAVEALLYLPALAADVGIVAVGVPLLVVLLVVPPINLVFLYCVFHNGVSGGL